MPVDETHETENDSHSRIANTEVLQLCCFETDRLCKRTNPARNRADARQGRAPAMEASTYALQKCQKLAGACHEWRFRLSLE